MHYDNGEVLPGLNESWTFMGANALEWASGLMVFVLLSLLGRSAATMMPLMLAGWVGTTVGLASIRRVFPDEERGLRNYLSTICGVCPIGLPAPSRLQPIWSGCPLQKLEDTTRFARLGLSQMFPSHEERLKPEDLDSENGGAES